MNTDGIGIGLNLAEKIVKMLNGKIWLNSVWGEGTSFFFSIPFINSTIDSVPKKETPILSAPKKLESQKLILVVEDDSDSSFLINEILRPFNLNIHYACNGQEALDFIKTHPDTKLILMDLKLPLVDGYEASTTIKEINTNIKIIAQTAYAVIGDREKAISAGCDDYISKPLSSRKLIDLVNRYLS